MNTNYILQYCTLWQYCQETWSFLGNLEFSRKLGVFSETWSFLGNLELSRKLGVFSETLGFLGNLEFSRKLGANSKFTLFSVVKVCPESESLLQNWGLYPSG